MCLLVCPALMGKEKEEFIQVVEGLDGWYGIILPKESPADTLLCGVFFAEDENAQVFTLLDSYNNLKKSKMTYEGIISLEKEAQKAAETHYDNPYEAQMMQQALTTSLERMYALYGRPSDFDPQQWSESRLMTIKSSIAKECGGGRLCACSSIRGPRHGMAAVSRRDVDGKLKWGFMDTTGRVVVPCCYDVVLDFNNRRYWAYSGFDIREDQDSLPWTVVRKGNLIGMIDNTGKIMVPIAFALYQDDERMVFHSTPNGELAAAKDPKTKKHGLIDRDGKWVIQPKYEDLIWDGSQNCFVYMTARYDHGSFTHYDKTVVDLPH